MRGNKKVIQPFFLWIIAVTAGFPAAAQNDSLILQNAQLPQVLTYAFANQPAVNQAEINQEITNLQIKNRLADWYPQVNFNYVYQHNFQLPANVVGGNVVRFGVNNTSGLQFTATQNIFNRDALLASRTKNDVRLVAEKTTETAKINLVASVSKNFYDLLVTEEQRKVIDENIVRLSRNLKDSRSRYDAGIVDKTDYQRATIALNNAKASKKEIEEGIKAKIAKTGAVERFVGAFPGQEQSVVRHRLSLVLKAVIAQQLLPAVGRAGRVAADEVLQVTPAVANLIASGRTAQTYSAIESGRESGMQTFDQALAGLARDAPDRRR